MNNRLIVRMFLKLLLIESKNLFGFLNFSLTITIIMTNPTSTHSYEKFLDETIVHDTRPT